MDHLFDFGELQRDRKIRRIPPILSDPKALDRQRGMERKGIPRAAIDGQELAMVSAVVGRCIPFRRGLSWP